jgi:hypothetical protein
MGRNDDDLRPSAFNAADRRKTHLRIVKKDDFQLRRESDITDNSQQETSPAKSVEDFASDLRWHAQAKLSERTNPAAVKQARERIKKLFKDPDSKE